MRTRCKLVGMTQTEQLLTDLASTADAAYSPSDEHYFDWSIQLADDTQSFEVGNNDTGDCVQIEMTRDQILALQQRLTAWLLATR